MTRLTGSQRMARMLPMGLLILGLGVAPALAGTQAGGPSERGVQPVVSDTGNSNPSNECRALTGQDDVQALQIAGEGSGFPDPSPYTDGVMTVTISDWNAEAKSFDWDSDLPVLGVWVKGGSGGEGNWYDYAGFTDQPPVAGADDDGNLHPKDNPNGVAGLSHATVCYGATGSVPSGPDLVIGKASDAGGPVRKGDTIGYRLTVSNVGDATASDVVVSDDLPTGVHPTGGIPNLNGAQGFCTAAGSTGPDGSAYSLYCEIDELAPGRSAVITATVEVEEEAACGDLVNVAEVASDDEPASAVDDGNTATVTDAVACTCDVAIAKVVSPTSGQPGDEVTYRYTVTNTGDALVEVDVTDDILGDIGDASLEPSEDAVFEVASILPDEDAAVRNVATVTARTLDGDTCTATDDATVTIVSGGGGQEPPDEDPDGDGGTAFTGPADLPVAAAVGLLLVGGLSLVASRRRRHQA